jgi:hypothetical protein
VGVPAFSVSQGSQLAGKPAGFSEQANKEYVAKDYHQPSDEYHADWDFSGLEELSRFTMLLGVNTANLERLPTWNAGDEFLAAREKSGVR